ncbi:Fe(3+)-siderophore ABC transporter permease [Mycetocola tolaasinivorans]|uniref:Fe(3+)-siderophore ABC transporter permease n=1 Tax=Mycetocola tolaasinivorans TaxID=76635 RepID=A0A3L7ABT0_9MICO|nr:iron chelate uptake ABC transporter family permease subunit [Mycetocola tolaasinivorans]RLP77946.1 Fe(3+)-siderophore ABC transporter permease [Mycetocola tolaasinivorans]
MFSHSPDQSATAPGARSVPHPHARRPSWRIGWLILTFAALVVLAALSIAIGAKSIPLGHILPALIDPSSVDDSAIISGLRVPRTVLGLLAGAALGVAGGVIQAFTRNPLADPGILGVNAGAALAVTVGVAYLGMREIGQYLWLALAGAIIATLVVWMIGASAREGATALRMTLAGVGVAAVLGGLSSAIQLGHPSTFQKMMGWGSGSLLTQPLSAAAIVAPVLLAGIIVAIIATRGLNALALGDDLATSLGNRATLTRTLAILAVTLLAGTATALVGPIAFVGLMIPHVARSIVGPSQGWILAYSLVLGPCLLLAADVAGRLIMQPAELPVGLVTAFVGAPVLILLVRRSRVAGL